MTGSKIAIEPFSNAVNLNVPFPKRRKYEVMTYPRVIKCVHKFIILETAASTYTTLKIMSLDVPAICYSSGFLRFFYPSDLATFATLFKHKKIVFYAV